MKKTKIIICLVIVLSLGLNGQALPNNSLESLKYPIKFIIPIQTNLTKQSSDAPASNKLLSPQISDVRKRLQISVYHSYESYNVPGNFIRPSNGLGELSDYTGVVTSRDADDATFALVRGLANNSYVSFVSKNYPTSYLRHQHARIELNDSTRITASCLRRMQHSNVYLG